MWRSSVRRTDLDIVLKGSGVLHSPCTPAGCPAGSQGPGSPSHLRQGTRHSRLWLGRPRAALPSPESTHFLRLVSLKTSACSLLFPSSCHRSLGAPRPPPPTGCQFSSVAQRTCNSASMSSGHGSSLVTDKQTPMLMCTALG